MYEMYQMNVILVLKSAYQDYKRAKMTLPLIHFQSKTIFEQAAAFLLSSTLSATLKIVYMY